MALAVVIRVTHLSHNFHCLGDTRMDNFTSEINMRVWKVMWVEMGQR